MRDRSRDGRDGKDGDGRPRRWYDSLVRRHRYLMAWLREG
jgi:hypothetical protein